MNNKTPVDVVEIWTPKDVELLASPAPKPSTKRVELEKRYNETFEKVNYPKLKFKS